MVYHSDAGRGFFRFVARLSYPPRSDPKDDNVTAATRTMRRSRASRILATTTAVVAVVAVQALTMTAASAAITRVYDSIPDTLAGNYPSLGYQATSTSELGDIVELASSERIVNSVRVVLSSWACETGGGASCVTGPDATFTHPLTLNFYDPSDLSTPIGTVTQSFEIPYRPSASADCGGTGPWTPDGGAHCYNGFATAVTFDLSSSPVTVPGTVGVAIAYDTQTYGASPLGATGPYNSLNVALGPSPVTTGSDVDADSVLVNYTNPGFYADSGAGGAGSLRTDTAWTGYNLMLEIDADTPAVAPLAADPPATATAPALALAESGASAATVPLSIGAGVILVLGIVALVATARLRRAQRD